MPSFPALRRGGVTHYGATTEKRLVARVVPFEDDSEQRWKVVPSVPKFACTLVLTNLDGYDLANVLEFWRSMKGRFDSTWDITINGTTYTNMTFDEDEFTYVESRPEQFSVTLKCVQTKV